MERIIQFYRTQDPYGNFSNFSYHQILLDGRYWKTTEHYFQAQKFLDPLLQEQIRIIRTPGEAAKLGRDRKLPLRPDWEDIKEDIMYTALYAKFTQYPELKRELLRTGFATLVEHTHNDLYWADGGDGSGKNRLGILLMRLRENLRKELRNHEK